FALAVARLGSSRWQMSASRYRVVQRRLACPRKNADTSLTTHRFTPTSYHNVIGTMPAALRIADGDTVVTRTIDAAGYDCEGLQRASGPNPMNGPIFIEGAEPGDALKVEILKMVPTRDSGFTRSVLAGN